MSARVGNSICLRCPTLAKPTSSSSSSSSSNNNLNVRACLPWIDLSPERKRGPRKPRLIKLSPAQGKHPAKWNSEYKFSIKELDLQALVKEDDKEAQVSINLFVEKHAGFGLSVEGNITSSLASSCSECGSPYCRQIDTNFHTWVLRQPKRNRKSGLDVIGGEDPNVIYVQPGREADIDSVVRHTLWLTLHKYETCSELCKNAKQRIL